MKKFLKSCLCLLFVISCGLIFAGCKGGNEQTGKKDVTVTVTCDSDEVYAYGNLPAISATAKAGSENVSGTIVWNANQTVTTNKTSYAWTFTPSDTSKYNGATGSKTLTVKKSTPALSATELTIDASKNLSESDFVFKVGSTTVAGTVTFENVSFSENEISTQTKKEVEYSFTPTDTANFNQTSGTVLVSAKVKPTFLSAVPDAMAMTSISSLEGNIASSFKYGSVTVEGSCKISETKLVIGKNTLHFTFTPTENIYMEVSGEVSVVAFNQEDGTYLVENAEQLMVIAGSLSNRNFKLANNISLTASDYANLEVCGDDRTHKVVASGFFTGSFDGNGKTISLDSSLAGSRVALFDKIEFVSKDTPTNRVPNEYCIKNLTVNGTGEVVLAVTVSGTSITKIQNVTMNGNVSNPTLAYAPFISHITGTPSVWFDGCINNVEIESYGTVSAFVLDVQNATTVMFNACENNANVSGCDVGLFVALVNENSNVAIRVNSCVNNADVYASSSITLKGFFDNDFADIDDVIDGVDGLFENNGTIELYGEMDISGVTLNANYLNINGFPGMPTMIKVISTVFVEVNATGQIYELNEEAYLVEITDDTFFVQTSNLAKVSSLENFKIGAASDKILTLANGETETENNYVIGVGSSLGYAQQDIVVSETNTPYITIYCYYEDGTVLSSPKISLIG